jgi:hypothetical protein
MNLSFSNGFNMNQINVRRKKQEFRNKMGGSKGLMAQSKKQDQNDISKPMNQYLRNPQEIENMGNVLEIERALADKNSLAKNWWDEGDNANVGKFDEPNDEALIRTSRESKKKLDNKLQPKSDSQKNTEALKSINDQLKTLKLQKKSKKSVRRNRY